MKNILFSPEIISALSSLITALIGLLIRKIEKAPLDKKIEELQKQATNNEPAPFE